MDGQYWKGDRNMSTNEWLLTSDFWQFLYKPWHGRWYEYKIFIASCTDNIYDLENKRWLLGDMIDHVGIYGSRVAEGRPSSCALRTSRRWTTNHSGAVAVTPSRPWSIPQSYIIVSYDYIPKGGILVSPCLSVRPSVGLSVDWIMCALYLSQHLLDQFHIYRSY